MRIFAVALLLVGLHAPLPLAAQAQDETLADIRQQLSVLYVEVQRLKRELSTTGAPLGVASGGSALDRMDAIEAELQRLTSKTEELEFRVDRVVRDGTNRIGDLEFRLVELEGGDISQLGETTTLGGEALSNTPAVPSLADLTPQDNSELAVGEEVDFARALEALKAGEFQSAAEQFETFNVTYPGGPLAAEAHLRRGQALEGGGGLTEAARAYLESYTGYPQSTVAGEALYRLGAALGKLGQTDEACVTLNEVEIRHPGDLHAGEARAEMQSLGCG